MRIIELIPKKGIEHIQFGMSRKEVQLIMIEKYNSAPPQKRDEDTDCYFENSLQFGFEQDETLSFIEVSSYPPIGVRLFDLNVWEIDGKELFKALSQIDAVNDKISEGGSNPIFIENIIALYDLDEQYDNSEDASTQKWGSIGIGDSRYYDTICQIHK
jgi:hypothetical protein